MDLDSAELTAWFAFLLVKQEREEAARRHAEFDRRIEGSP